MLIAGLVCIALAAAAAAYAYWQHRKHQELAAVETSSCGQMRELADAVSVSAGAGGFRQRCELTGVLKPAYAGTVKAPQTGRDAVWYRTKVTHEYYDLEWETDNDGDRRQVRKRKSRVLRDETSDIPFSVDDGTGQAVVHPEDADIHAPAQVLDQMERQWDRPGFMEQIGLSLQGVDDTIGYRQEEWVLAVDTRVFVQGEVTDEDGHLRLRKPAKGTFRVSTQSEEELAKEADFGRRWAAVAAAVLAVVGLGLVVAGLVA